MSDSPEIQRENTGSDEADKKQQPEVKRKRKGKGGKGEGSKPEINKPLRQVEVPNVVEVSITEEQMLRFEGLSKDIINALGTNAQDIITALGTNAQDIINAFGQDTQALVEAYQALGKDFKAAVETFGTDLKEVIEEFGKDTTKLVEQLQESQRDIDTNISEYSSALRDSIEDLKLELSAAGNKEEQELLRKTLAGLTRAYERQTELMEAQTPEPLRVPTRERMIGYIPKEDQERRVDRRGVPLETELEWRIRTSGKVGERAARILEKAESSGDEGRLLMVEKEIGQDLERFQSNDPHEQYQNRLYQQEVESWFEDTLRQMESSELAFEEQREQYYALSRAQTFLEFRDETKALGKKLGERLEARRIKKRTVRVWNLNPPSQFIREAAVFTIKVQKELFTYKEKDELSEFMDEEGEETSPIVDAFWEYEELGEALKAAHDEEDAEKDALYQAKRRRDPAVAALEHSCEDKEGERKRREKEVIDFFQHGGKDNGEYVDAEIKKLEEKQSQESLDRDEISRLEGLRKKLWARRSAGELWSITLRAAKYDVQLNGTGDFYAARDLNFGRRLKDSRIVQATRGIWDPKSQGIEGELFDLGMDDYFTKMNKGRNLDRGVHHLETDEYWDGFADKQATYIMKCADPLEKTDETRKAFWGTDSFFANPDAAKLVNIYKKVLFDHVLDDEDVVSAYGGGESNPRTEKFAELVDRSLKWMETKDAEGTVEQLKHYRKAEIKDWIDSAATAEMITEEQRFHFYREHFHVPIVGWLMNKEKLAENAVTIDSLLGNIRKYKGEIAADTLWETIKRLLAALTKE